MSDHFKQHFTYGSFLAVVLFLLGNYIVYLIINDNVSTGIFLMIISLVIYILNNVLVNIFELESSFNDFLENVAVMITFGLSTIVFGVMYYNENPVLLFIILFYSVCLLLSLARNNVMSLKNSIGWPVPLNGIFFPLVYFFYLFYFNDAQNTIFIFYYVTVGILSVSSYNFLGNIDAQAVGEKQDMRYQAFKNNLSKKRDMDKYKKMLHHEEIKQEKDAEKVFEELDKVNKEHQSQKDAQKAFHENGLHRFIRHLSRKLHWIKPKAIRVQAEEIKTIEEDIHNLRTNKIKKQEIEEVFLDTHHNKKEKKPKHKPKHKEHEHKTKKKHHLHIHLPHLHHKKDIKDIEPEDIKNIPRISIEEAIAMPIKHKKEKPKHKPKPKEEKPELKKEKPKTDIEENIQEDLNDHPYNFKNSTFQNKKRL